MPRPATWIARALFCLLVAHASPVPAQLGQWVVHAGGQAGPTGGADDRAQGVATDLSGNAYVTGFTIGPIDLGGGLLPFAGGNAIFLAKYDPFGNHLWSQTFGGTRGDAGLAITTDADGNVFVTGYVQRDVDLGGGETNGDDYSNVFVAKYDTDGNHIWSNRYRSPKVTSRGRGIEVDSDGNVYVTGDYWDTMSFGGAELTTNATNGAAFMAKYDPLGNHVWSQGFTPASGGSRIATGWDVAVDPNGNPIFTGQFWPRIDFGGGELFDEGSTTAFLVKFTPGGEHVWSIIPDFQSGTSAGYGVDTDLAGNIFVSGNNPQGDGPILMKYNPDGTLEWRIDPGPQAIGAGLGVAVSVTGEVAFSGWLSGLAYFGDEPIGFATGGRRLFAAKFRNDGTHVMSTIFGGGDVGGVVAGSVAVDLVGSVIVAGEFRTLNFYPLNLAFSATSTAGDDMFVASINDGLTVPVAVQNLRAEWTGRHVELSWQTVGAPSHWRFRVSRSSSAQGFRPLTTVEVADQYGTLRLVDRQAHPGTHYAYRLDVMDAGIAIASFETSIVVPIVATRLEQNHPNPFNPRTVIPFVLRSEGQVRLTVHDLAGHRVRTLLDGTRSPGADSVEWDGRDDLGQTVAGGTYFFRLVTERETATRKAVLLK